MTIPEILGAAGTVLGAVGASYAAMRARLDASLGKPPPSKDDPTVRDLVIELRGEFRAHATATREDIGAVRESVAELRSEFDALERGTLRGLND